MKSSHPDHVVRRGTRRICSLTLRHEWELEEGLFIGRLDARPDEMLIVLEDAASKKNAPFDDRYIAHFEAAAKSCIQSANTTSSLQSVGCADLE